MSAQGCQNLRTSVTVGSPSSEEGRQRVVAESIFSRRPIRFSVTLMFDENQ
jgi:hypothetical protein